MEGCFCYFHCLLHPPKNRWGCPTGWNFHAAGTQPFLWTERNGNSRNVSPVDNDQSFQELSFGMAFKPGNHQLWLSNVKLEELLIESSAAKGTLAWLCCLIPATAGGGDSHMSHDWVKGGYYLKSLWEFF